MIVSFQIFKAYLECSTKCWLRSGAAEPAAGNAYGEWACKQNEAYSEDGLKNLLAMYSECDRAIASPFCKDPPDARWRIATDVPLRTNELESRLQAVERIPSESHGRPTHFIPYRFEFANKLAKEHKLLLAFDALLLSESVESEVNIGKIIHGDRHITLKVELCTFISEVRNRIKAITALLADGSPPDLVLNRHCGRCEFQTRCNKQAKEKDELSLLSGMSEKYRKRLRTGGIFTVTQLSYKFRPRRRSREAREKPEKYHHSLRALAIRENKIHAVGVPNTILKGTPIFLDVEGLPDRDFYYLIGIRIQAAGGSVQYSFWADDAKEERLMWNNFLNVLSEIKDPHLIHYGSFETIFLKRMCQRHGGPSKGSSAATAIDRATNLLSLIYAQIYFPTYSNGLKDIAGYLGFRWSGLLTSGVETIVWRRRWEEFGDSAVKQILLDYNGQDCEALELVAHRLDELHYGAHANGMSSQREVVLTSDMKRESPYGFKRNEFVFPEMEIINRAAYWDYQRERIYVKSRHQSTRKRKRETERRHSLVPNATIEYSRPSSCPTCKSKLVYGHGKRSKIVVDLRFMRHGVKRWITRYIAQRYRCRSCRTTFYTPDRGWTASKYGPDLVSYSIYQNIELRLPQSRVALGVKKLFGLDISRDTINRFKATAAQTYEGTYRNLLERLCGGRLLHVDETNAGVMGKEGYVWALTSLEEAAYFHTPTRAC